MTFFQYPCKHRLYCLETCTTCLIFVMKATYCKRVLWVILWHWSSTTYALWKTTDTLFTLVFVNCNEGSIIFRYQSRIFQISSLMLSMVSFYSYQLFCGFLYLFYHALLASILEYALYSSTLCVDDRFFLFVYFFLMSCPKYICRPQFNCSNHSFQSTVFSC